MARPVPIDVLVAESERLRRELSKEARKLYDFADLLIRSTHEGADDDRGEQDGDE